MRLLLSAALIALAVPAAAQVTTRQVGTATLQNVPAIPADVSAAVQRYQNYREAVFQDWLPDGSMPVSYTHLTLPTKA